MILYDLIYDYSLIEASFLQQYGIRLEKDDILIPEFYRLLENINIDTPLGQIAHIRGEKDYKIIKKFNKKEKEIRREWAIFLNKNNKPANIDDITNSLLKYFGGEDG